MAKVLRNVALLHHTQRNAHKISSCSKVDVISYGKDYCKKLNDKDANQRWCWVHLHYRYSKAEESHWAQRCGKELVTLQKYLGVLGTLEIVEQPYLKVGRIRPTFERSGLSRFLFCVIFIPFPFSSLIYVNNILEKDNLEETLVKWGKKRLKIFP